MTHISQQSKPEQSVLLSQATLDGGCVCACVRACIDTLSACHVRRFKAETTLCLSCLVLYLDQ